MIMTPQGVKIQKKYIKIFFLKINFKTVLRISLKISEKKYASTGASREKFKIKLFDGINKYLKDPHSFNIICIFQDILQIHTPQQHTLKAKRIKKSMKAKNAKRCRCTQTLHSIQIFLITMEIFSHIYYNSQIERSLTFHQ